MVSKASANEGSDCKGIVKPSGYPNFNSTGNSSSSFIDKVSSEKANKPVCNKKFRLQSVFELYMQEGTKLVTHKFRFEQWKGKSNLESRTCNSIRCYHDRLGGIFPKSTDKGIFILQGKISAYKHTHNY